jgi:hypothetical protein
MVTFIDQHRATYGAGLPRLLVLHDDWLSHASQPLCARYSFCPGRRIIRQMVGIAEKTF